MYSLTILEARRTVVRMLVGLGSSEGMRLNPCSLSSSCSWVMVCYQSSDKTTTVDRHYLGLKRCSSCVSILCPVSLQNKNSFWSCNHTIHPMLTICHILSRGHESYHQITKETPGGPRNIMSRFSVIYSESCHKTLAYVLAPSQPTTLHSKCFSHMSKVGLIATCLFSFKRGTMFLLHTLRDPGRSHLSLCPLQGPSLLFADGRESLENCFF